MCSFFLKDFLWEKTFDTETKGSMIVTLTVFFSRFGWGLCRGILLRPKVLSNPIEPHKASKAA